VEAVRKPVKDSLRGRSEQDVFVAAPSHRTYASNFFEQGH
jgi:hypothetical protein